MAERKGFLLRLDPEIYDAMQRWAGAELRSLNAQMEFVLRRALVESGRLSPDQVDPAAARARRRKEKNDA